MNRTDEGKEAKVIKLKALIDVMKEKRVHWVERPMIWTDGKTKYIRKKELR